MNSLIDYTPRAIVRSALLCRYLGTLIARRRRKYGAVDDPATVYSAPFSSSFAPGIPPRLGGVLPALPRINRQVRSRKKRDLHEIAEQNEIGEVLIGAKPDIRTSSVMARAIRSMRVYGRSLSVPLNK